MVVNLSETAKDQTCIVPTINGQCGDVTTVGPTSLYSAYLDGPVCLKHWQDIELPYQGNAEKLYVYNGIRCGATLPMLHRLQYAECTCRTQIIYRFLRSHYGHDEPPVDNYSVFTLDALIIRSVCAFYCIPYQRLRDEVDIINAEREKYG